MSKGFYRLLTIVILFSVVTACAPGRSGDVVDNKIKIGAILPLTGEFSILGEQMQRGMELALQDYPEANIKLVYEDDHTFDNRVALTALNKLVTVDRVVAILNPVVNTIKALAPVLNEQKVPGIVFWDNTREMSGLGEYVFSIGFSTELAGEDMAIFAYSRLDDRRVAVISHLDEWSGIIANAFIAKFTSLGGKVVLHVNTSVSETDFKTNILKAKQSGAEALYSPFFPQSVNDLVRQARELGYQGDLLSAESFTNSNLEDLGSSPDGIYFTQLLLEDKTFISKYQARYQDSQSAINLAFAGLGYDVVPLIVDLLAEMQQQNIDMTSQAMQARLVGFPVRGVTGAGVISTERTAIKRESILVVKDGGMQLVK